MTSEVRQREATVAKSIAAAHLTDALIKTLARCLAGKDAATIEAELLENVPPESRRIGVMLPYLVAGPLVEYPIRVMGPTALTLAAYCAAGPAGDAALRLFGAIHDSILTNPKGVSVGCEAFYHDTGPIATAAQSWQSPAGLAHSVARLSPAAIFATQGLSAARLGTGYDGAIKIKGNLPESNAPADTGLVSRAVASDPALAAAANIANSKLEVTR